MFARSVTSWCADQVVTRFNQNLTIALHGRFHDLMLELEHNVYFTNGWLYLFMGLTLQHRQIFCASFYDGSYEGDCNEHNGISNPYQEHIRAKRQQQANNQSLADQQSIVIETSSCDRLQPLLSRTTRYRENNIERKSCVSNCQVLIASVQGKFLLLPKFSDILFA